MSNRPSRGLRRALDRGSTAPSLPTIYEDRVWSITDSDNFAELISGPGRSTVSVRDHGAPVGQVSNSSSSRVSENGISRFQEEEMVWRRNDSRWVRCNKWVSDILPDTLNPRYHGGWKLWENHRTHRVDSTSLNRLRSSRSVDNIVEYYYDDESGMWWSNPNNRSATSLPGGNKEKHSVKKWFKRSTVSLTSKLSIGKVQGFGGDIEDC